MDRIWIAIGGLAGFGAVAMDAAASHVLAHRLDPAALAWLATAIRLQEVHALALVATGVWAARGGWLAQLAGVAFTFGMLLFCGALFALALGGVHLGVVAPSGGFSLMAGWLLLAASALRPGRPARG